MALVEEWLLKNGYYVSVDLFPTGGSSVLIYRLDGKGNLPEHAKIVTTESRLLALALAVESIFKPEQKPEHDISDKSGNLN